MGDGIQITIPDFGDDGLSSAPISFGRSAFTFGSGGFGGSTPTLDSPTIASTPFQGSERSYFSHSRADSAASIDSAASTTTRFTSKPSTLFSHSAQPSLATSSTAFSKKPSFASIRNAFKSGKHNDPPPMPQIDHSPYPVLKNPFNRSTSSLNQVGSTSAKGSSHPRPATPVLDSRFARALSMKPKGHGYSKSQQSHTGSVFHASDAGSDYGHNFAPSPPPVPRVPTAFSNFYRDDTPPLTDFEEDKVVMDPKSPSDYALHAVFIRFATSAEEKIDFFLRLHLDQEHLLTTSMGTKVDANFDETLASLGIIAQKNAKKVIDSIMRWRRSQIENVGSDIIRVHLSRPTVPNQMFRPQDVPGLLNERKSLASIYIMCRALIAVLQSISKDALGDALGYSLEETTFEQFRNPDRKLLAESANHRINSELYATLLGHLTNVRFISVTDRFLAELTPVALGQVSKDSGTKYENLVKGLQHIKIKVWPPEAFEEGAEFMESLSKSYANAHGPTLKISFAETLILLLHPIGKTAQAETNNPQWGKAIETIYPKAREMMSKPRYWQVAFPLVIISLCVAPQSYFLKHWQSCFEHAVSKLKEKPFRVTVMNGLMRLIWTYLYRCQESASTTTSKLDGLLKHFFPSNRTTVFPSDDHLETLTYITHFILSRHSDHGRELCLELIQESSLLALQKSGNIGSVLAPERTAIAINAVLLSFHNIERDIPTPSWPSSSDFSIMPSKEDYPTSSNYIPSSFSKPGMQEFLNRCSTALGIISLYCSKAISHMSVFDDQWLHARLNPPHEESHNYIIRRHSDGIVVFYPSHYAPHMNLLQTCFQAWPRCLQPSIPFLDVIDILLRGVIHVEPGISEAAISALKRCIDDDANAMQVISRFNKFLYSPSHICHDSGFRLYLEFSPLRLLWVDIVDDWIQLIIRRGNDMVTQTDQIISICNDVEVGSLLLLAHNNPSINSAGVKVVRLLGLLSSHLSSTTSFTVPHNSFYLVERLRGKQPDDSYLRGYDDLLDKSELSRLDQWRKFKGNEVALRIVDSPNEKDRKLWRHVFPAFLQSYYVKHPGNILSAFRESIVVVVSRYHPSISHLAGLSSRMPPGLAIRNALERDGSKLVIENRSLIDQWHIWVKILCATAILPDLSRPTYTQLGREHTRGPSDASFERERLSTTRGLFRYLTPFLDSEYVLFRDAAVLCISSFPANAYPQLLEDLSLLAGRQFYDDPRSKIATTSGLEQNFGLLASRQVYDDGRSRSGNSVVLSERNRRQERLHSAVARIYCITAHFLEHQRSFGRQAALSNILKFVRNTQVFLCAPDMRDNYFLHSLRQYFCGIVERLFDGLASLKDTDRFIPLNMHLTLYRLCEEWCQLGPQSEVVKKRQAMMQRAVESIESSDSHEALQRFRQETAALSDASVRALAALSQKAFFQPEQTATSPTERVPPEFMKPLTAAAMLDRLSAILTSSHEPNPTKGKIALKSLLTSSEINHELIHESLRRAIVVTDNLDSSNHWIFEVIAEIVSSESHNFSFAQIVCLGLTNLRHPSVTIRCLAFDMLEAIHHQHSGLLTISTFEGAVSSLGSVTYIHAHRQISDFLAGEHPDEATNILAQLGDWLPQLPGEAYASNAILLTLQSLEFWIPNISLMTDDKKALSSEGLSSLYHLTSLTLRYGQSHAEQILLLWSKMVDSPQQSNGHAAARFLLEQAHKVGNTIFVSCASNIIASLCQTHVGRRVFEDLCSVIVPIHMLPTIDHKLSFPEAQDMKLWEDLDALFVAEEPRLSLGSAQFAWMFLADVSLQRYWEMTEQLPVLLHAIFTHLDHRIPFIRHRAHSMLFQLLRSWTPGYDELPDRSTGRTRSSVKESIVALEQEAKTLYWQEDDSTLEAVPKMKILCTRVLSFLEPLALHLVSQWGSLALTWGTACSIRATAFRSLQLFRALMPRVKKADFALLLGRLSNTIASPEKNIQSFTSEIFLTIITVVASNDMDKSLLPQVFWCTVACLSTTVEQEFNQAIILLDSVLAKIDLDDLGTTEQLLSHRPAEWKSSPYLQPALLKGLRSSSTSTPTMKILSVLARIMDNRLIDPSEGRIRDLYTVCLPWCLQAMDNHDNSMKDLAEAISILAAEEKRHSIHKIMTSFSKGHFRTRDDFLRQSVASLREHYGAHHWVEIVTLLLGLVLNEERWLRVHAMQVLKVLFQHRETRNPVEPLGSELLMPLLRLLESDLAPQALDVLEEPMAMSGRGPAAKHVLRMSMHFSSSSRLSDPDSIPTVFGIPEESGWCIAQADELREICRANVMAVFDTCSMPTRPSRVDFEPELEALASLKTPLANDVGGLVKNLHELTNLFNGDGPARRPSIPTRRLEARVAAILAKSIAPDSISDIPQTPFIDVFRVSASHDADDTDSDSDSDSDTDAFVFDSISSLRSAPNGARYH